MSEIKRIMVSLPAALLEEVDSLVESEFKSRSQLIRKAMKMLIRERSKQRIREELRKGYMKMGQLNLVLSEEGFVSDKEDMEKYEQFLSECELDDQKRRHLLR